MENLAKPSLGFFRQTSLKRFLLALLTIAALSGAVLLTPFEPRGGVLRGWVLLPT